VTNALHVLVHKNASSRQKDDDYYDITTQITITLTSYVSRTCLLLTMESSSNGVASLNDASDDDNISVEDYSNLDISFDDIGEMEEEDDDTEGPGFFQKPSAVSEDSNDPLGKPTWAGIEPVTADYILGTLIVRVVAARDIEPVSRGGLGKMLFGGNSSRSGPHGGSANPYASCRFGATTQRTSEVFDSLNPIWPRGETMYMDVLHSALPDSIPPVTEYEPCANTGTAVTDPLKSKADDATKSLTKATVSKAAAKAKVTPKKGSRTDVDESWEPVLTVALFHNEGLANKYPSKKGGTLLGDSDDQFLGMTAVNLTQLLTGKVRTFDEWLPLTGCDSARACVRIVCEYEASDAAPRRGDSVRFTNFCHPADLYPLHANRRYRVEECDGDDVLLSYTSPEGWISSFLVHRFMLVCEERHQAAIEMYQDELASIKDRFAYSPFVSVITQNASRVPDEGLVTVASDAFQGGISLFGRLATPSMDETDATQEVEPKENIETQDFESHGSTDPDFEPLPNMPSCPITGTNDNSLRFLAWVVETISSPCTSSNFTFFSSSQVNQCENRSWRLMVTPMNVVPLPGGCRQVTRVL
jgi:hypothetical protein